MYEENAAGVSLAGSTGVTTTRYSKSAIISGITRSTPNTYDYREPDILTDSGYDDTNYGTAGFSSLNEMASKLVSEYITMTNSVAKYGGFYIGRYELTANGTKPGATITETDWYTLYANCKSLTIDESVALSRMIWECQWDMTCNFIANYGDKKSITDSTSWGNYYDAAFEYVGEDGQTYTKYASEYDETYTEANGAEKYNIIDEEGNIKYYYIYAWEEETEIETSTYYKADGTEIAVYNYTEDKLVVNNKEYTWDETKEGYYSGEEEYSYEELNAIFYPEKLPTGSSEHNKANNIYDFAGNCEEWTQEAFSTTCRACRRRRL